MDITGRPVMSHVEMGLYMPTIHDDHEHHEKEQESNVKRLPTRLRALENGYPPPSEDVILYLREALKLAKTGAVQGVGIALAMYAPDNVAKMETRHIFSFENNYEYCLRVALDNLVMRMRMDVQAQTIHGPDPVLSPEDENE